MVVDYKRLMKKYLYLLFCSIIMTLIFGYVYINHYFSFIVLIVLHVALVQLLN